MPTYSHSRLETYENCPMQYKLRYIDKVEIEEVESVEAFMGTRVHEVLDKLYKDVRMTKVPAPEEVLAHFDKVWEENWHDGINIVKSDYTADHYRELGRRCIADYYEAHYPFDESRTISTEHLVFFPLDDEEQYWIRGVIDRIAVSADGIHEIHDYKTSGRLRTQDEVDSDRQLALYHIAVQKMWPDIQEIDLVWHYLVFGKELRSRRTAGELNDLRLQVMSLIKKIEADADFQPRESGLCDWCPYPAYCPAKKHLVMTAGMQPNEYLREPGVKLVNRFAELHRRKGEIEEDIGRVREALIGYARENRVEVIRGSDNRVLVRFYKGLAFPGKDHPARGDLEKAVKDAGLWERVAVLSPVSLAKLVEGGRLEPELAQRISRMGWEEERPWVKLAALRRGDETF